MALNKTFSGDVINAGGGTAMAFRTFSAKSVLANSTNASAVPTELAGSAAFQHLRVNSANNALEWATLSGYASTSITYTSDTFVRAALTGAITASANSNTTSFGTAAAKSVLVNATNATAVPSFLAGSAAFQYLRVGSANTSLEWATLSGHASTSITYTSDTFVRAALTGAIAASADSNATVFAGILDNGSAENNRTNLNFVSSTSNTLVVTDDAGNDELEITVQRAALTGDVTASANSNATTIANDAVTTAKIADSQVTIQKMTIGEEEVTTTGTINDQTKTVSTGILMFSGASAITLNGVDSTSHSRGMPLLIQYQGASTLDIVDNSVGSSASNRFANYSDETLRLRDDEAALFIPADIQSGGTDAKRWLCVSHRYPFHNTPTMSTGNCIRHNGSDWELFEDSHFTAASTTIVSASNVETTAISFTIPADSLVLGATYEMVLHGATNRGATATAANLTVRLKTGGATSANFAAQAVQTSTGINLVDVRATWKCGAVGVSGTIQTHAMMTQELGTRAADCPTLLSKASGSFNTGTSQVIGMSVQFSASVTDLSFEVYSAYIRRVI